jgi:ABC-type Na+ efflux pump permease subunit
VSRLLVYVLGIPLSAAERDRTYRNLIGELTGTEAAARLRNSVQHNTEKAGALLAAQGIFAVAGTFALDHGWPKAPVLTSMLLMFIGSLLVLSILRATVGMYAPENADASQLIFHMLLGRIARFNVALYLTFIAIILLVLAALSFVG